MIARRKFKFQPELNLNLYFQPGDKIFPSNQSCNSFQSKEQYINYSLLSSRAVVSGFHQSKNISAVTSTITVQTFGEFTPIYFFVFWLMHVWRICKRRTSGPRTAEPRWLGAIALHYLPNITLKQLSFITLRVKYPIKACKMLYFYRTSPPLCRPCGHAE